MEGMSEWRAWENNTILGWFVLQYWSSPDIL